MDLCACSCKCLRKTKIFSPGKRHMLGVVSVVDVVVKQIWFADYKLGWSGISRLEYVAKWCSQVSNSNAMLLFLSSRRWSLGRAGIPLFRIYKYSCVCFGEWNWCPSGFWELLIGCWEGCKARLPVGAEEGPLLHCQPSAWAGQTATAMEMAPGWGNPKPSCSSSF